VWRRCVLPLGICVLTPLNLVIPYLIHRASLTGFEAHPEFDWSTHIVLGVVLGPIGGYLAGLWLWRSHEAAYLKGEQTDAA
jgi:hypothetical protein